MDADDPRAHMPSPPTGTVTFLLTDIEHSTTLWERDAERMRDAVARHDALIGRIVHEHGGTLVKSRGEGLHRSAYGWPQPAL